jgi:hypothetical protein
MTGRAAGLGFAFHEGRTVVADFSVGQLTSNAVRRTDHLPLRQLADRLGPEDVVALESNTNASAIARLLKEKAGTVLLSNPLRTGPALKLFCDRKTP